MSAMDKRLGFRLTIVVESDGTEFHAYCLTLKGLHTSGETEEEALQNAKDAAIAYLQSLIKHNDPIPLGVAEPVKIRRKSWTSGCQSVREYTEDVALAAMT